MDVLYSKLLSRSKGFAELWFLVWPVLILPHGNARAKSGFSTNKSLLQERLLQQVTFSLHIVEREFPQNK